MEIVSKTILLQIITQCTGTQDIIKKLASCGPGGRKSGFKSVAFLLRLSIYVLLLHVYLGIAILNGTLRVELYYSNYSSIRTSIVATRVLLEINGGPEHRYSSKLSALSNKMGSPKNILL